MKSILHLLISCILSVSAVLSQENRNHLPKRNQQIIDTILRYGPSISPTYEEAVCTEFVLGILDHFVELTHQDTINVRIDLEEGQNVYELMAEGSALPTGVYYALIHNGIGIPIDDIQDVQPGDFVQFWYYRSWGHCGIVHQIDYVNQVMWLYSSYPSTNGYGIQPFQIPDYCYFVRLK